MSTARTNGSSASLGATEARAAGLTRHAPAQRVLPERGAGVLAARHTLPSPSSPRRQGQRPGIPHASWPDKPAGGWQPLRQLVTVITNGHDSAGRHCRSLRTHIGAGRSGPARPDAVPRPGMWSPSPSFPIRPVTDPASTQRGPRRHPRRVPPERRYRGAELLAIAVDAGVGCVLGRPDRARASSGMCGIRTAPAGPPSLSLPYLGVVG